MLHLLRFTATIEETRNEISIGSRHCYSIVRDIEKVWKTTRITTNIFRSISRGKLTFNKFFAPDILYMMETIRVDKKRWTPLREVVDIINGLKQNTWLRTLALDPDAKGRLDFSKLKNFKKSPLPHQEGFLEYYDKTIDRYGLNGALLAGAAGSGKTILSLMTCEMAHCDKTFVICPSNAVDRVWVETVKNEFTVPKTYWAYSHGKPYNGEDVIIAHYEAIGKVLEMVKEWKQMPFNPGIILDESHNLNETTAQRTVLFIELCRLLKSKNIIFASGTPFKAMGSEAIPLLRTLDPLFNADAEDRFKKIYGREGNRGVDILRERLGFISFKVEKSELKVTPPIIESIYIKTPNGKNFTLPAIKEVMRAFIAERVEYYKKRRPQDEADFNRILRLHELTLKSSADKVAYAQYRAVLAIVINTQDPRGIGEEIKATNLYEKNYILPNLNSGDRELFKDVKSIIKYTGLKIQGECLGRVLGRKRIECNLELSKYVDYESIIDNTEKKTIVFTSFVEVLESAAAKLSSIGYKPLTVYGKTNNELASTVKRFDEKADLNPLVATYNSLSTAVPLVMADRMIMLNAPFRGYILEQAISRIYRIGQETQTYVYQVYLDTGEEPNISTRSSEILAWSISQVEQIMGIKSPFEIKEQPGLEDYTFNLGEDDPEAANVKGEPEPEVDSVEYDDNEQMRQAVANVMRPYDVPVSNEDFKLKADVKLPAYLNW